jgi:hypothetical protein
LRQLRVRVDRSGATMSTPIYTGKSARKPSKATR